MTTRYAIRVLFDATPERAITEAARMERYMPSNYSTFPVATPNGTHGVLIAGEDFAGWTLTMYVLPRLASGLFAAREISATEALNAWNRIGAK